MELLISLSVGIVVGSGVYLILQRELLRVIMGSLLLGYGINMALFLSGGIKTGGPPILGEEGPAGAVTDPLPQALILTAIVIGLGVFALLLALGYRTFQETGTTDLSELAGVEHE
ncbi:MAG: Na(+)/H(+) antiporter subunit C [Firmicutes bacterium]|jgi:multicomponent Na+:H+ antiporter subunit C|nr:Na(+)/H(+) antiporter subunit C [Bacillota bacterium]